jgi:hypothetical protein
MTQCAAIWLSLLVVVVSIPITMILWHLAAYWVSCFSRFVPDFRLRPGFAIAGWVVAAVMVVCDLNENTVPCGSAQVVQAPMALAAICPIVSHR